MRGSSYSNNYSEVYEDNNPPTWIPNKPRTEHSPQDAVRLKSPEEMHWKNPERRRIPSRMRQSSRHGSSRASSVYEDPFNSKDVEYREQGVYANTREFRRDQKRQERMERHRRFRKSGNYQQVDADQGPRRSPSKSSQGSGDSRCCRSPTCRASQVRSPEVQIRGSWQSAPSANNYQAVSRHREFSANRTSIEHDEFRSQTDESTSTSSCSCDECSMTLGDKKCHNGPIRHSQNFSNMSPRKVHFNDNQHDSQYQQPGQFFNRGQDPFQQNQDFDQMSRTNSQGAANNYQPNVRNNGRSLSRSPRNNFQGRVGEQQNAPNDQCDPNCSNRESQGFWNSKMNSDQKMIPAMTNRSNTPQQVNENQETHFADGQNQQGNVNSNNGETVSAFAKGTRPPCLCPPGCRRQPISPFFSPWLNRTIPSPFCMSTTPRHHFGPYSDHLIYENVRRGSLSDRSSPICRAYGYGFNRFIPSPRYHSPYFGQRSVFRDNYSNTSFNKDANGGVKLGENSGNGNATSLGTENQNSRRGASSDVGQDLLGNENMDLTDIPSQDRDVKPSSFTESSFQNESPQFSRQGNSPMRVTGSVIDEAKKNACGNDRHIAHKLCLQGRYDPNGTQRKSPDYDNFDHSDCKPEPAFKVDTYSPRRWGPPAEDGMTLNPQCPYRKNSGSRDLTAPPINHYRSDPNEFRPKPSPRSSNSSPRREFDYHQKITFDGTDLKSSIPKSVASDLRTSSSYYSSNLTDPATISTNGDHPTNSADNNSAITTSFRDSDVASEHNFAVPSRNPTSLGQNSGNFSQSSVNLSQNSASFNQIGSIDPNSDTQYVTMSANQPGSIEVPITPKGSGEPSKVIVELRISNDRPCSCPTEDRAESPQPPGQSLGGPPKSTWKAPKSMKEKTELFTLSSGGGRCQSKGTNEWIPATHAMTGVGHREPPFFGYRRAVTPKIPRAKTTMG